MPILLWLLNNKKLALWILAALALTSASLLISHWRNQANLYEAAKQEVASCHATATELKGINDGLQKSRDSISARLVELKRLHPTQSIVPKPDAKSARSEHAGTDGSITGTADQFRDFAAQCETYRSERIALERYINAVER